jgi:esterase/lipase superfamily enzyme
MIRAAFRCPVARLALPIAMLAGVLAGCDTAPILAPAPYVMLGEAGREHYRGVPNHLKTSEIPVLYWTDRRDAASVDATSPEYGPARSEITFYGVATVAPERDLTWGDLLVHSTNPGSNADVRLEVTRITKDGNVGSVLSRLVVEDGHLVYPDDAVEQFLHDLDAFNAAMEPWLVEGDDNAAIVFVHGFNNTFDGATLRLAKTWHAIGRDGVPILFTWPAGSDAFLKPVAYNHDRESGEFAVQSLKKLLFALALNDRIDRVHLVAHSRGTDVASTAIREIETELAAALGNTPFAQVALGRNEGELGESAFLTEPSDITKIDTLTLVAADMDLDVFLQRFVANRSGRAAERVLIYTSAQDRALGLADFFFDSDVRLGQATHEDFGPDVRALIAALPGVELIECRVKTKDSHLYLFEHPATLSDMVLAIREGRPAGAEHGRPLKPVAPGFWVLDETYLAPSDEDGG